MKQITKDTVLKQKSKYMIQELENRINYISVDKQTAMSSLGEFFKVGELVKHDAGEDAGKATIISFTPEIEGNEIRVDTNKGFAHLDFLVKLKV